MLVYNVHIENSFYSPLNKECYELVMFSQFFQWFYAERRYKGKLIKLRGHRKKVRVRSKKVFKKVIPKQENFKINYFHFISFIELIFPCYHFQSIMTS